MSAQASAQDDFDGCCNCLATRQASRYLTAVYDQALSPVGLRATQFSILYKLVKFGPLTIGELANRMAMDRTTLSTNLKPLERDRLVDIVPGVDRRVKQALVTGAGLLRYQQALPLWKDVQSRFENTYGQQSAAELRDALRAVLKTGFEPWAESLPAAKN
ncbi:winged helix-turn-helix transcriptional regulator [Pseudomonas gingeri]|uniref:MarR family winged helix-turn-helix transcriptional regulator n=1 Tax=Pseudomonas gingeri TaxID=117681 RepID=UPI0015A3BEFA|nr:MarR family winged helix-turn-helix transcriptional regulator [Pseudomonas gingeri]NWA29889.1 winged helix-turn-helix transcriptional regulator [Pseudomonas gingeri]